MTLTYIGDLSTDLDKVRFHLADTDSAGYYLEDATITALLTSEGSVGGAVVAGIKFILRKLSQPNFRADWLQVDNKTAREGWQDALKEARKEFGLAALSVETVHVYRADSRQTEAPDYSSGTTSDDDCDCFPC